MGTYTSGWNRFVRELLFWGGLVALASWIFIGVFMPAYHARTTTRTWVGGLRDETESLKHERDRLATLTRALEDGDKTAHEAALRRLGYVPDGRVRLVPAGTRTDLPVGVVPPAESPSPSGGAASR